MISLEEKTYCPTLEEIEEYVGNPVFGEFCEEIKREYGCREKIEFSSCSWEKGWNIKFKKAGKTLCTIYPRIGFFTVLVVIGKKEKEEVESCLGEMTPTIQELYYQTKEGNGQRWLMIDLEDREDIFQNVLWLIRIRRGRSFAK